MPRVHARVHPHQDSRACIPYALSDMPYRAADSGAWQSVFVHSYRRFAHNIPVIEEDLIQQTNIPQKDLEILEELQLAAYSVPIYCRK